MKINLFGSEHNSLEEIESRLRSTLESFKADLHNIEVYESQIIHLASVVRVGKVKTEKALERVKEGTFNQEKAEKFEGEIYFLDNNLFTSGIELGIDHVTLNAGIDENR